MPGLAAKDVIDILVSVASLDPEDPYREPLERLGYTFRPDDDPEHRLFKLDGIDGRRIVNIHVCTAGGPWEARHLAFRDYLRAHPESASDYEQLKRELSRRYDDANEFAGAKSAFIEEALRRATAEGVCIDHG